jgi:Group II intron, maturase-specific domain
MRSCGGGKGWQCGCRSKPRRRRARRTRPGVGAPGASLCSLRGRQQHLRSERAGGSTGDGERYAIQHPKAPAQGKRGEGPEKHGYPGGATAGTEVRNGCATAFLGFSITAGPEVKRAIAPKALDRFRQRIREIARRAKGVSMETTMEELAPYMRGWRSYFGFCDTPEVLIGLTRWVRLRLRAALWRQWKTPRRRRAALTGTGGARAAGEQYRRRSRSPDVTNRTAVYGPVRTVVWQGSAGDRRPYADHLISTTGGFSIVGDETRCALGLGSGSDACLRADAHGGHHGRSAGGL